MLKNNNSINIKNICDELDKIQITLRNQIIINEKLQNYYKLQIHLNYMLVLAIILTCLIIVIIII